MIGQNNIHPIQIDINGIQTTFTLIGTNPKSWVDV